MAPNSAERMIPTGPLSEEDLAEMDVDEVHQSKPSDHPCRKYVWRNIILFVYLHIASLYGLYLALTSAKWSTVGLAYILYIMGGLGVTMGSHRLWSHRSYKARLPLRILLAFWQTLAFQNDIFEWSRDHRVHHRYSETDADPHDARRGFLFSHVGWLCMKKHPQVIEKGKEIDVRDILADPVVYWQKRFYFPLILLVCFTFPTWLPMYMFGESFLNAFFVCAMFRYCFTLNVTWLVNSAAHLWGMKPYDQHINPSENYSVAVLAVGEGWHNFHHTFPWDYKTAEFGRYRVNISTMMIDFFALLGQAYDLKTVSPAMVKKRVQRTGDGSHASLHQKKVN